MEPAKRITIQDIARRANVSISTVSRVINNTGYVAENKRQAVAHVIQELNYRPNLFAQSLASGQSMTIGVLTQALASPLYDIILRYFVEALSSSSYSPLIADGNWVPEKELAALRTFLDRSVDGLVVLGGNLEASVLVEIAQEIPMIVIARDIPELGCQSISLEDYQGAYEATRYLIEAGHRRIAHITGIQQHQDTLSRIEGYQQALRDAGFTPDPNLIIAGDYAEASGLMAVEMLMMRGGTFSAIFAANDQMAYGARLALHRRGIRVPDDISIVGFDDQGPSAYMIPPLTSVHVPAQEIGAAAAQGLLRLIKGEGCDLPRLFPRLAIRESVARR